MIDVFNLQAPYESKLCKIEIVFIGNKQTLFYF